MVFWCLLSLALSQNLEYRFQDYGSIYYDYSGNGNHGTPNGTYQTDRGVYLLSTLSCIHTNAYINIDAVFTVSMWVLSSDTQSLWGTLLRISFIPSTYNAFLRRSSTGSLVLTYMGVDDDGGAGSFLSNIWSLILITYDGYTIFGYNNNAQVLQYPIGYTFTMYLLLYGDCTTDSNSMQGFIWFTKAIESADVVIGNFGPSSSSCILNSAPCTTCNPSIYYSSTQYGCLSTNFNYLQDSFGDSCGTSYGCFGNVGFNCPSTTNGCSYNSYTNVCSYVDINTGAATTFQCGCPSGYNFIGSYCCGPDCASCNSAGKCLTCIASHTNIVNGACQCASGYYSTSTPLTTSNACTACGVGCSICTSASSCQSCFDSNSQISGGTCTCNSGVFNTNTHTCGCNSDCASCDNTGKCLTCIASNSIIVSGVCQCATGFYASATPLTTANSCSACGVGCSICTSASVCTTCYDSNTHISGGTCYCNSGVFDSSTNTCKCDSDCATCDNTGKCLTCIASNSIIVSGVCQCATGFYASATPLTTANSCSACGVGCSVCTSTSSCQVCFVSNSIISGGACSCISGIFNINTHTCDCDSDCASCDNTGKCLTCIASNTVIVNGVCNCVSGFYSVVTPLTTLNSCASCGFGCSTCTSTSSCQVCFDSTSTISGGTCICSSGVYNSNTHVCSCDLDCATCDNTGKCLTCIASHTVIVNGVCQCALAFYAPTTPLTTANACSPCGIGCSLCTSISMCQACYDSNSHISLGICICSRGNFDTNTNRCVGGSCNSDCATCDSTGKCLTCIASNSIIVSGVCQCALGFYAVTTPLTTLNSCSPCGIGCNLCNSVNPCITCFDSNALSNNINCVCNSQFFANTPNSCASCGSNCQTCSVNSPCLSCVDSNANIIQGLRCECREGYSLSDSKCVQCGTGCANCTSSNLCIDCISSNAFIDGAKCLCDKGFFADTPSSCSPCPKTCFECEFSMCLSCIDHNSHINPQTQDCVCNSGLYYDDQLVCEHCPNVCETCSNYSTCLSCIEGFKLVNGSCVCPDGFYLDNDHCNQSYFECNLNVSVENVIGLTFSEPVMGVLTLIDFQITFENSSVSSNLTRQSTTSYSLIPHLPKTIANGESIKITILRNPLYSVNKAELKAYTYEEILYAKLDNLVSVTGTTAVVLSACGLPVSLSSYSTAFWTFLNTLDMLRFIPLGSGNLTKNIKAICAACGTYSKLDYFAQSILSTGASSAPSQHVQDCNVKYSPFLVNMFKYLLIFCGMVFAYPVIYWLAFIKIAFIKKKLLELLKSFQYTAFIRLWVQIYLSVGVFALVQFNASYQRDAAEFYISMFSASVFMFLVILTPIALLLLIKRNIYKIINKHKEFVIKYEAVLENIRTDKGIVCLIYWVLFCLRRILFIIIHYFSINSVVQLTLQFSLTLSLLIYLIIFKPFTDAITTVAVYSSECCILICFALLLCLEIIGGQSGDIIEKLFMYVIVGYVFSQVLSSLYLVLKLIKDCLKKNKDTSNSRVQAYEAIMFRESSEEVRDSGEVREVSGCEEIENNIEVVEIDGVSEINEPAKELSKNDIEVIEIDGVRETHEPKELLD